MPCTSSTLWADKFQKRATQDDAFWISADKSIQAPLMNTQDHFHFAEANGVQVLELPYMNHALSMVVLLPKAKDGLAGLEKSLSADNLAGWLGSLKSEEVKVTLPKFTFTTTLGLADA